MWSVVSVRRFQCLWNGRPEHGACDRSRSCPCLCPIIVPSNLIESPMNLANYGWILKLVYIVPSNLPWIRFLSHPISHPINIIVPLSHQIWIPRSPMDQPGMIGQAVAGSHQSLVGRPSGLRGYHRFIFFAGRTHTNWHILSFSP